METVRDALTRAWALLTAGSGGEREWRALRIETGHPIDVFAAVREQDKTRGILFECPITAAPPWRLRFDSEGLRLSDERDAYGGTRRIALALERTDLESVFLVIAEDLIVSSRAAPNAADAVSAVGARLSAWQACLKLRREGFSQERMLGLYGELILLQRLAEIVGFDRAVASWTGPERGLHDFSVGQIAIEVKTCLGAHGSVQIGSLEQLDPSGLQTLALCRVVVVRDDQGVALPELIAKIRSSADDLGHSIRRELDQRLLMSGYIDPENSTAPFDRLAITSVEAFDVQGDFPRLTREAVAAAVLAAEYRLDLAAAKRHQITTEGLDQLLARFGLGV